MAIGKQGIYYLNTDSYEGDNPLTVFGAHAAEALKELDSYDNVPDVVVNSFYKPETGEVAAFEELVGSHGGLGGPQNRPFLLYPTHLQPEGLPELVGTTDLNRVLRGWLDVLQPVAGGRFEEAQPQLASRVEVEPPIVDAEPLPIGAEPSQVTVEMPPPPLEVEPPQVPAVPQPLTTTRPK